MANKKIQFFVLLVLSSVYTSESRNHHHNNKHLKTGERCACSENANSVLGDKTYPSEEIIKQLDTDPQTQQFISNDGFRSISQNVYDMDTMAKYLNIGPELMSNVKSKLNIPVTDQSNGVDIPKTIALSLPVITKERIELAPSLYNVHKTTKQRNNIPVPLQFISYKESEYIDPSYYDIPKLNAYPDNTIASQYKINKHSVKQNNRIPKYSHDGKINYLNLPNYYKKNNIKQKPLSVRYPSESLLRDNWHDNISPEPSNTEQPDEVLSGYLSQLILKQHLLKNMGQASKIDNIDEYRNMVISQRPASLRMPKWKENETDSNSVKQQNLLIPHLLPGNVMISNLNGNEKNIAYNRMINDEQQIGFLQYPIIIPPEELKYKIPSKIILHVNGIPKQTQLPVVQAFLVPATYRSKLLDIVPPEKTRTNPNGSLKSWKVMKKSNIDNVENYARKAHSNQFPIITLSKHGALEDGFYKNPFSEIRAKRKSKDTDYGSRVFFPGLKPEIEIERGLEIPTVVAKGSSDPAKVYIPSTLEDFVDISLGSDKSSRNIFKNVQNEIAMELPSFKSYMMRKSLPKVFSKHSYPLQTLGELSLISPRNNDVYKSIQKRIGAHKKRRIHIPQLVSEVPSDSEPMINIAREPDTFARRPLSHAGKFIAIPFADVENSGVNKIEDIPHFGISSESDFSSRNGVSVPEIPPENDIDGNQVSESLVEIEDDDDDGDFRIIGGNAATGSGTPLSNRGRSGNAF